MELSVLRMEDGFVTLVDDVNLKRASLWQGGFRALGQRAQEGVGDLLNQTGYSQ